MVVLAVATVTAASATPATASISGKPHTVGHFKVLGGSFKQKVDYLASYETIVSSDSECRTYKFNDQGGASFDLKFDKGDIAAVRAIDGQMNFRPNLAVSGSATRKWSGTLDTQPGPSGGGCTEPPAFTGPQDAGGCGTKKLDGAASSLSLLFTKKGSPNPAGVDGALAGVILRDDPFEPCPSDSVYGLLADVAPSTDGAAALDKAKIGETVTLGGSSQVNAKGPNGFVIPFTWVAGSQLATLKWSLKLMRVKPAKKPKRQ